MAATTIGTWYGPAAGPTSKFRVVSQLRYTDTNETGRFVQKRQYVEVTVGASFTWVSVLQVSWTNTRYALGDVGIYGDTGWKDVGWVNFGSQVNYGCSAEYVGGSGKLYKSEITGSYLLPVPTFTIAFSANGGTGAPAAVRKTYGTAVRIPSGVPTRQGYIFRGWAETASGTAAYQPGDTFTEDRDATLYAAWERVQYTISYDANSGSGAPAAQRKEYGRNLRLSDTVPVRTGYKFMGWAKSRIGVAVYQPGGTFSENASVVLYAVWSLQANCKIKVNGQYRPGMMYVRKNGRYQTGSVKQRNNGAYRDSKI